jgi:hypothetical protein
MSKGKAEELVAAIIGTGAAAGSAALSLSLFPSLLFAIARV